MEATRRVETAAVEQRPEPRPASGGSATEEDVEALCFVDETAEQCAARNEELRGLRARGKALQHLRSGSVRAGVGRGRAGRLCRRAVVEQVTGAGFVGGRRGRAEPLPHVVRRRDDDLDEEVIEDDDVRRWPRRWRRTLIL